MSKTYTTHPKHTQFLYSPPQAQLPDTMEPALPPLSSSQQESWSAIPKAFWESDSDDDHFDYLPAAHKVNLDVQAPDPDINPDNLPSDDSIQLEWV